MSNLDSKFEESIWVAKSLFERGKTSGSSANISFREGDYIYISGSGTCFGTLKREDFSITTLQGESVSAIKPSKELPLHLVFYQKNREIQAVIHVHSFYATLWSCLKHKNEDDVIPTFTPYLGIKVGSIASVPYAEPGSKELFAYMINRANLGNGFLLCNHGPIIGGQSIMDVFYQIEELEESAKIAWYMRNIAEKDYNTITD